MSRKFSQISQTFNEEFKEIFLAKTVTDFLVILFIRKLKVFFQTLLYISIYYISLILRIENIEIVYYWLAPPHDPHGIIVASVNEFSVCVCVFVFCSV